MTLRNTLIFIFLLVSPYFIYIRYGSLSMMEPYPAVILPDGAGFLYKDNDTISFNYSRLYASRNNQWEYISSEEFLYPIPSYYFNYFLAHIDWLENPPKIKYEEGYLLGLFLNKKIKRNQYRKDEADEFKYWLSRKISVLGYESDSVMIRNNIKYMSMTKSFNYDSLLSENIFYLNEEND